MRSYLHTHHLKKIAISIMHKILSFSVNCPDFQNGMHMVLFLEVENGITIQQLAVQW